MVLVEGSEKPVVEEKAVEEPVVDGLSAEEEEQPPPEPAKLPPAFYRVQHAGSHTLHDAAGFESRGHYHMHYKHYITSEKIHRHLDPLDRSSDSSPFISMFDNEDEAWRHASEQQRRSYRGIFIARIDTDGLRPSVLDIDLHDGLVRLPVWKNGPEACQKTVFVSTADARKYLKVDPALSRESEWFATDRIPRAMIGGTESLL
ncbi:uncharacterized protein DNG_06174 [Cephalotrichum gorgonifer]|uniref:DUF7587 domain-containing protein n=1 Tax=Cephalotrichum gorgonifer TaxID=2041049 RepID=A0AAE8MZA7_9PEZI|nr:uncharacterized protein DNG_06174 [Cephalotrichum gorgonifer]